MEVRLKRIGRQIEPGGLDETATTATILWIENDGRGRVTLPMGQDLDIRLRKPNDIGVAFYVEVNVLTVDGEPVLAKVPVILDSGNQSKIVKDVARKYHHLDVFSFHCIHKEFKNASHCQGCVEVDAR